MIQMENVITEFKIIETEDGFRIEIKGDKEKLRPFITGSGWPKEWRHRQHGRGPGFGRGPFRFGFPPAFWMGMGPWWGPWDFESEGDEETKEV
jgi:hypothetical protein